MGVHSFFCLDAKERSKEKVNTSFTTLLQRCTALQAIELASLKQNRLLNAPCIFSV